MIENDKLEYIIKKIINNVKGYKLTLDDRSINVVFDININYIYEYELDIEQADFINNRLFDIMKNRLKKFLLSITIKYYNEPISTELMSKIKTDLDEFEKLYISSGNLTIKEELYKGFGFIKSCYKYRWGLK